MKTGLSIIIPAYNAENWIRPTTDRIFRALRFAHTSAVEVIIVNDGSVDKTLSVAKAIAKDSDIETKVLSHKNVGRFLTRKRGVLAAQYDTVLFIDTRIWIKEDAIDFLLQQRQRHPERKVWNGHVFTSKEGNVIARFGDAVTSIGWRQYFQRPRLVSFGLEDFDLYPKGTGLFWAPTELLREAIEWFERTTTDLKNSSDDTLLIRHIASQERIWLSPKFTCTYFARTTLVAFVHHTYFRGQYFVDGFLRPGTRFFVPLLGFLGMSLATVILLVLFPGIIKYFVAFLVLLWFIELIVALSLWIEKKDALSLFLLTPLFALFYGLGIWRAVIRRLIKL